MIASLRQNGGGTPYYAYIYAVNNSSSQAITTKDLGIFNTVQETNGKTIYTR